MTWHGMRDDARNVGARHFPHLSPESVKEDVLLLAGVERSGGQFRRTTQPRERIDATAVACGSPDGGDVKALHNLLVAHPPGR